MSTAKVPVKTEKKHALLSASGAHRWLHCTPSARLEESLPDNKSEAADEGTLAHEISELKLRKAFIEPLSTRTFNNRLKKLQENPLYQDEMLRHTDTYVDYVYGIAHGFPTRPYIAVEKEVQYQAYAPEGFGTSDCIIIGGSIMYVIDFKYGKGVPVSAWDNPQMKLYALGAYMAYAILFPITTVKLVIIQPRLDSISEYEISLTDLLAWGESIKPTAEKAFKGEGEYIQGEHCQFCRAAAICRKRMDENMQLEECGGLLPPLITNEEVGQILLRAQNLASWVKKLEAYALKECLNGNVILGWKAVQGTSRRQWTDQDGAFQLLKANGTEEAMLYKREPLTAPQIEELIGKAKFKELLTPFVDTPPGKPTLVQENDKREAIQPMRAADFFKDEGRNDNE